MNTKDAQAFRREWKAEIPAWRRADHAWAAHVHPSPTRMKTLVALVAAILITSTLPCRADNPKVGFTINVEGDGFFLNPVVSKIVVTKVEKSSLAEGAGIVAGDEIVQIEGQTVAGKRARELQPFMTFNAGETRSLRLKHVNGEQFNARITKPKE